jgi:hypothetical protein
MANTKISALTELTAPASGDYVPIVDASEATDDKTKKISVDNLFSYNDAIVFTPLTTPLTSTSWDGDSFSSTNKTLIDLSAVFGAPAGIKAVLVKISLRDSGSAAASCVFQLSGISSGNYYSLTAQASPINDRFVYATSVVPCDENGDLYYNVIASGASTMDIYLEVWGYWL